MSKTKAKLDFSDYRDGALLPIAQNILTQLTDHAAQFPNLPWVPATTLGPAVTAYKETLAAKSSRATADVIAFQVARRELEGLLAIAGGVVNATALGDPSLVAASGFPSYETRKPADLSAPVAPANLRLRHGELSGWTDVRFRPGRARSLSEVQLSTSDPNDEAGWKSVGMFTGGKAVLKDIAPGTVIWVRVRTAGLNSVMGAWSDPAKIMVV